MSTSLGQLASLSFERMMRRNEWMNRNREQFWARYWRIYKIRHPFKYRWLCFETLLGVAPMDSLAYRWWWMGLKGVPYKNHRGEIRIATTPLQFQAMADAERYN